MNELLLVTETRGGMSEHNFVSTLEEFARKYMEREDEQTVNDFGFCIEQTTGQTDVWSTYYMCHDVVLDVRACAGEKDLKDFLTGRFNDSVENIEKRLPGSSCARGWYWQNDVDRFSPNALDIIQTECPEFLRFAGVRKAPLDEKIASAASARQKIGAQTEGERLFENFK